MSGSMEQGRAECGGTQDLALLSTLDQESLLEELRIRYFLDQIYTYIGDILVALNPFKYLTIYSPQHQKCYRNVRRSRHPPHIFAVADSAYQQMCSTDRHQCCVISGESGAGKTESAKLLVSQLMELSESKSVLEQKIMQANPLLEAFGNAKTAINDNSSRFGKYLQLKFKNHRVSGAKINEYLLEKSRVVSQSPQEQNFHIFYYLFAGLNPRSRQQLGLTSPTHFNYLQRQAGHSSGGQGRLKFAEVSNALDLVGFETEFQAHIFTCLAAVLHLGNVEFIEDNNEYSHILDPFSGPVNMVSVLLGVDVRQLVELLTVNISFTRGEAIRRHLNKTGAIAARDALAKALYDRMFRWVVNRINQLLAPTASDTIGETEIGILDIFGFEKFEQNGFEQMCINVANEQLQHFFTEHVFLLEEEAYKKEGVVALDVQFSDNQPLLDMFLAKSSGLYALLDEQCNFPRATDASFISKLSQAMKKRKSYYIASKSSTSTCFSIIHYAGKVEYTSTGFLDKNKDSMPNGAISLLKTSTNPLVQLIFTANVTRTGTLALSRLTAHRLKKKGRESKKLGASSPASKSLTIGAQFKNSLSVLMEKMKAASPHFVRCIKPNNQKSPETFDPEAVMLQLRYTGMLETIRIRRDGYPHRPLFQEFIHKYGALVSHIGDTPSAAESCRQILEEVGASGYKIGKTKVFLRDRHSEQLNDAMTRVHSAATVMQKVVRGFVQRCKFAVKLETKREQDGMVATLLLSLFSWGEELFMQQLTLSQTDQENPLPSAPPLDLLPPPSSLVPPPGGSSSWQYHPRPLPPPPPDLSAPPPEPVWSDVEEDDAFLYNGAADEPSLVEREDTFVAPARRTDTYGREGTRSATRRWFEETQAPSLRSPSSHLLPDWLHDTVTRREAEQLLADHPPGTFLVRVCETRFGFSLSVRTHTSGHVSHLMVSQLETGKYVVVGSPKVHSNLSTMLLFYCKNAVSPDGTLLSGFCSQTNGAVTTFLPQTATPELVHELSEGDNHEVAVQPGVLTRGISCLGDGGQEMARRERGKPKLSRTRSHEPGLGYGALGRFIDKKSHRLL